MESNPVDTFLTEADDLLAEIEAAALSMSLEQDGGEVVNQIFRAFHTIKGSGAMFGFEDVAAFTHHVETLLDRVREGVIPVSEPLASVILAATDHIKALLQAAQGGEPVDAVEEAALLDEVHELSAQQAGAGDSSKEHAAGGSARTTPALWRIHFRPDPSLLAHGGSPELLFRDLRKLGPCVIEGHIDLLPDLVELRTDVCYLWWTIQLATSASVDAIRDVFLFVEDGSELRIEAFEPSGPAAPAVATAAVPEPDVRASAALAQPREATVRVPATRLDRLVNLVGELVMNQSRLQAEREIHNAATNGQAGEVPGEVSKAASEECGEVEFF